MDIFFICIPTRVLLSMNIDSFSLKWVNATPVPVGWKCWIPQKLQAETDSPNKKAEWWRDLQRHDCIWLSELRQRICQRRFSLLCNSELTSGAGDLTHVASGYTALHTLLSSSRTDVTVTHLCYWCAVWRKSTELAFLLLVCVPTWLNP